MARIILMLFIGVLFTSTAYSQDGITLTLDNIVLTTPDGTLSGASQELFLARRKVNRFVLVSGANASVTANIRIRPYQSRNQHKDGGIQMRVKYICTHNGKRRKVRTTRVFFLESNRQFSENQTFVFDSGLRNSRLDLSFNGSMPR
ncbi:MAG: hypothetical protein RL226_831 [Bacteroidota bacterium]